VSEAEMLSDGAIAFPSLRQYGYAYFDSRIFGHAPGKIFDETDCWLLLRRGVVLVDNPQINTLLAWSEGKLHIILTNQSREEQPVVVTAGDKLGLDSTMPPTANLRHGHEAPVSLNWDAKARGVQFRIPARGLATLTLSGVKVDPPARPHLGPTGSTSETTVSIAGSPATVHAAALQVEPESWYAYIWSAASPGEARGAILHYQLDGHPQTIQKSEYPFEFLVPIPRRQSEVDFEFEHILPSGAVTKTRKATVRAAR